MNKLEPVITEKSMKLAEARRYTFRVDRRMNKDKIRKLAEETFGVHVVKVTTIKESPEVKRTYLGRKRIIQPKKKAIVEVAEKEKIDLFETKKK